jgi:hypothetical protein
MDFREAADTLKKQGHKIFTMSGDKGFRTLVDDTYSYTPEQLSFLVQNRLKPGTLIWSRVVFNSDVSDVEATELMTQVVGAYRTANLPKGVEVYRAPATGGIVYYFSPEAASLIPPSFASAIQPCLKPDLSTMKKQQL